MNSENKHVFTPNKASFCAVCGRGFKEHIEEQFPSPPPSYELAKAIEYWSVCGWNDPERAKYAHTLLTAAKRSQEGGKIDLARRILALEKSLRDKDALIEKLIWALEVQPATGHLVNHMRKEYCPQCVKTEALTLARSQGFGKAQS